MCMTELKTEDWRGQVQEGCCQCVDVVYKEYRPCEC